MLGKNNHYLRRLREGEKITHYTIKKLSVGVASVAVGSFIMLNSGQAYAAEPASVQPATAHTQAESSDGTGASQESSVSEQAAVLSASSEEASLVSAESSQSSETSASSESANSNEANSSESSQSSADESKPEQKEDGKLEPSRQNDTRKTPGYAVKPVEKPASAAMPRPDNQGTPMTQGSGLRGSGTGAYSTMKAPTGTDLVPVIDPQSLNDEEKRRVREAFIRLNPNFRLSERNIDITDDGKIVIIDSKKQHRYEAFLDEVVTKQNNPAATATPTVNPTTGEKLSSTDERITGRGIPGATIKVTLQDNSVQTTKVDPSGDWSITLTTPMRETDAIAGRGPRISVVQSLNNQDSAPVTMAVDHGNFYFRDNPLSTVTTPDRAKLVVGQKVIELLIPHDAQGLSLETNITKYEGRGSRGKIEKFGVDDNRWQLSIRRLSATAPWTVNGGGTFVRKDTGQGSLIQKIENVPGAPFGYQILRITVSDDFKIKAVGDKVLRYKGKDLPLGPETDTVVASMQIVPRYAASGAVLENRITYADASNSAPSIEVAPGKATKEVSVGQSISDADILSMVNVSDPEDDARQTVGTPVTAEIVSRTKDGQNFNSIDTSSEGEYTVTLRAKDSQGKLSDNTVQVQVLVGLKREAAKQAVADAAQRKNTEIENNVDLTTEERAVERQKVTDAQNSANAAIDQAKTSQALATAQNNGTGTINALTQTPVVKPAARAAIEAAANNKVQQINKSQSLTNEERTDQIAAIRQKEAAAKQAVAAQTSTQDVTSTQNAQVQAINDTPVLAFKKPAALAAIEAAEATKRQQIQDSQMLPEEKTAVLRDLDSKVQAAKDALKTAQSNQDVQNVENNQLSQIQAVPTQSPARQAATNEIMDAYNARKQLISNESWLTTDEKNEKLRELETAKDEALERVNQANGEYELNSAKVDGISTVNSVSIQGTKKLDAKNTVDTAREAMSTALNATSSDWTAEEKLGANDKLLRIAEATEARILAATSNDNLQQVVNEMLAEIEAVKPPAIVKPAARKAIEEALAERIKQIQAQGDLTVEEREQYLEKVKQAAQDAHQDILASYGEVEVESAKEAALTKINAPAVPVKRNTALAAVRQEAETKRQEIENNLDLTANERDVLLGQVDQVLAAAEQAINQGARNADVEDKQTEGTNNIRAIQVQASVRPQAIQAVTEQADAQRLAINQAQGLTENERQAALNQLDQTLARAIEDIKAADDNEEVGNAKTKGIQAIQAVTAVAKIKNEAIQSVRQVADAKKDNILQNTDLTSEERKTLTDAIEAEVQKAVGLINQANSNETVTAEKNLAEETIANLLVTPEVKPNAIKELQDQAAIKTREIQENKSLTDEERQKFTQDLQQALDNAKKQIQDAENNQAVSDAKTQGLSKILAVSPYGQVKADALAEIEVARVAKSQEIQSKEGLTAEERQAAETRLATEVQTAKDSIGQAADNAGVGNAKSYGLTAIQAIKPEPLTKQAANEALDNAAQTKRQQITDNKNLTTQEKQAAIAEVDQALATAKGKVEQAAGRDDVAQAQAQGLNAIGDVTGQALKKPQANADIEAAVAAKRQEIEGNKTMTSDERQTAFTQLESKHQDALQAIADAASNEDVEQALNTHKSGIESFTPTASVRQAALDAFDREAQVRANTINNYSDFTDEEREDHKQRFEALRDQLRQMIQDAGTDREVEDARDNGISGIHGFSIVATKKSDAVKSLNEEAKTKRQQIQTAPNLTDEERVELNQKVDQVLADVVLNVHRQKTNDKVQEANETGVEKIRAIGTESKIKAAANQALGTAAENKRNEIRQNNLLTKEEKDKAIESVDKALTDALQAIQQATTNQQVGDQESQGLQAIQDVPQTPVSKPTALAEVRQAAANKTSTIQSNDNLTSDEKAEAIQKVNTELAKAEKDINEAADDLTVGVVKQGGITNIGNVQAIPSVKPAAIYELEEAASNRRREIQQTEGLTKEEREQALAQVENALQTARQAITQADSNAAVATQKTQGIQNIQAVTATPNAKPTAINEIEAAAETRRKEIQELPGLTQDEINAAKERVNQAATLAKREVEAAADQKAVDQAKTNGLVAINAVTQEAKARPDAIKEVVAAADRKKAELRDNQDLTIEERAQLIQDVDTAVDRAKDAINAAETNDKVAQEQTNGTQAIAAITANPVAKPAAKSAIEAAAQARREAIDRLEGLTSEEKNQAKLAVTAAETDALEKLKQAQQKTDVDQVESDGIAAIKAVPAQAQDKPNALQEIQTAAEAKKRQIEASKAFTQEEKNEAIQKINQAVQDAQAKINQAEDRTGVSNAKGDGLAAIEAIQAVAQTKPEAIAALEAAAASKRQEIEQKPLLTNEEREQALAKVNQALENARQAINQAPTDEAVGTQKAQGIQNIQDVTATPTAKQNAIASLEEVARNRKQEVLAHQASTTEEREAAASLIEQELQSAIEKIKAAADDNAVNQQLTAGKQAIQAISPSEDYKAAAKREILEAANRRKDIYKNATQFTSEEKEVLDQKIDTLVSEAYESLNQQSRKELVDQEKERILQEIQMFPINPKEKPFAITEINGELDRKVRELENDSRLTSEERDEKIQEARKAANDAINAIGLAPSNNDVAIQKMAGVAAIHAVTPQPKAKPEAIQAIERAAETQRQAIQARPDLTQDEKDAAKEQVTQAAATATKAVEDAPNQTAVEAAKTNGTSTIAGINPAAKVRPDAIKAVEAAADAKKRAITDNKELTAEEKAKAIQEVTEAVQSATAAINAAGTNAKVAEEQTNGTNAIAGINPSPVARPAAQRAIEAAAQARRDLIEQREDLTTDEKAQAKQAVTQAETEALEALKQAQQQTDVEQAQNDGISRINGISPVAQARPAANALVEAAANTKRQEINSNDGLTDEEKQAAIAKVDAAEASAKADIKQAASTSDVEAQGAAGKAAIEAIKALDDQTPSTKDKAKAAIEEAARTKKNAIESDDRLTREEKAEASRLVDEKAQAARTAIEAAKKLADVQTQEAQGKAAIEGVPQTPTAKDAAKQAVQAAAALKKDQISKNNALTEEEKAEATRKVEEEVTKANQAIDAAETNDDVTAKQTAGTQAISGVSETAKAKPAAIKEVEDAAEAKKQRIQANGGLTEEERTQAIAKVNEELAKATAAIQRATTQGDVTGEQTKGIAAINNVAETPSTKTEAKDAIERAAETQRQAIQARPDLTQDEKDAAKEQVTQAAATATKAVEDAPNQTAVEAAKTNGTSTIAGINPAAKVRPDAIKAVEAAADAKKRAITDNKELTAEEKAKAIQEVTEAVQSATAAINAAGTNAKVAEEQTNGTNAIAGINPSPVAKPAALAAVEQAANVKKAAIQANDALTSDEKAEAERKVNEELSKAQQAINAAADDATVTAEKDKGVKAISDLTPTPVAKPSAQEAIQALADTKKGAIQADNRLTQEEKNTAINQIQAAADAAKQAIASANSDSDVANEKTAGEAAINAVAPTPTVKPTAKDQVQAAADAKKQLIQDRGDLTKEEKKAAKAAIDKAAQDAQAAIDAATTDGAVANEKANGLAAIEAVTPGSVAKTDAKQAINAAANLKKDAIQERTDLTQEEKEEAIKQVEEAAKEARNKVDTAATDAQVVSEKDAGLKAITDVTPNPIAKPTAKQAVQDLADLKKSTIEADKSLTREEKDAAIKQVEDAAKKAKEAIDAAPTNSQVATDRDQGKQAIADVTPVADAKPKAKEAVEQAANAKKAAIEADKNLTREEKDAAISAVDQAAQAAKTAIAEASDNSTVANEQGKGTSAIAGLTPVAETKPKAKEALEQAANAKKAAIEANNNLTREEKDAAKAKVDAAVAETKDAIDAATTNAEVAEASKAGADLIDALNPSADKKTAAKDAIDAAVKTKTDAIDARTDLTQEEKDAAKAKLAQEADKAKAAIDAASTNSDVDAASQAASSAINGFNPTADAKTAAKAAIDQAVADKAKEIDARTDLTQEEKEAAKAKLADAAKQAKAAIDAATTNAEVDAAVVAGTKSIAAQSPSADAKTAAKAAIDQAVADKAKEIDARTDLTQEEKDAAKAKLADAANKAKEAIDAATTNAEVDAAVAAGTKSIKDQSPSADAKNAAKAAIDQAVADKAKEIDARTDLTQEEKDAAKAKLADAANKAKAAIDAATTNAEVDAAVAAGTKSIADQSPTADAKTAAKAAIDQAVADKAKEIDARTDLTQEEKEAAKAKLADAAKQAKAAIDSATTNAEVDAAVAAGTKSIKDQSPSADAKTAAKAAIDQAVADKAKEIDARTDLTQEEKDAAKAKLADAANKAKAAIDAASTNAEVDAALAAGTKSIKDQSPSADAKTAAKAAIDQAVADKAKEIDARTDLTQEEKDAAKAKLADAANKAKEAIDAATTNAEVDAAVAAGTKSIKDQSPSADAKNAAKAAIDQAVADKAKEIDARTDLTQEEKDAAKAKLADAANKAKAAIDAATTNADVAAVVKQAQASLKDFSPSSDSKSDSKLAIDQAGQAKIDALKARKDLNDADKAKAIAQVQDLAQKAKDAIDQASSQDQVKAILDQALADIAALNPAPSQVPCPDCETQAPCPDCDAKKQGLLPATGETSNQTFFSAAALAVLAGLGLVAAGKRKDEEEQVS